MRAASTATALLLPLLLAVPPAPAARAADAPAPLLCDSGSALTPIGVDTAAGRVLLAVPPLGGKVKGSGGDRGWIAELSLAGAEVPVHPDSGSAHFGGSVGPGPVVALASCGSTCLQPVRWEGGAFRPLGEPLLVPAAVTGGATYDLTGSPWVVVHGKGGKAGETTAWAYRLVGREWKRAGGLTVAAVGDLPAVPAPQRKDGIVSGTGLFAASGPAEPWARGLPDLPPARQGQVIALGGGSAAYLSADGAIYLSPDGGRRWRRSVWTPWGADTTGIWRQGKDFWVDLPVGDRRGPLQLAWFDRRQPNDEKIVLTRLSPAGEWISLAESPSEVRSKNGERLPVNQVLTPTADTWVLLSGCAATAGGSGLVLRAYEHGAMAAPRFLPFGARRAEP
jgi:hypothetical protein